MKKKKPKERPIEENIENEEPVHELKVMKKKSKKPEVDIDDLQLSVHLFPSVVHMYQH